MAPLPALNQTGNLGPNIFLEAQTFTVFGRMLFCETQPKSSCATSRSSIKSINFVG